MNKPILRVIEGGLDKPGKPDLNSRMVCERLYADSLIKLSCDLTDCAALRKACYLGVKSFLAAHYYNANGEKAIAGLQEFYAVTELLSILTPPQFMTVFNIKKTYDGARYGNKDYFDVMNYIAKLPQDKSIDNNINNFLWSYHNDDIRMLVVTGMHCLDEYCAMFKQPGLIEPFMSRQGINMSCYGNTYFKFSKPKSRWI